MTNKIDPSAVEAFDSVFSLNQTNRDQNLFEFELESIEELLGVGIGGELSSDLKHKSEEKLKNKNPPRRRENILTEIARLKQELASRREENRILRNQLNVKREGNKKLELLFKQFTAKN